MRSSCLRQASQNGRDDPSHHPCLRRRLEPPVGIDDGRGPDDQREQDRPLRADDRGDALEQVSAEERHELNHQN